MKKSFFIALAIYLVAGALLWQFEWPKEPKPQTKRISLASLTIKKPQCQCQKCTCKSHLHPKKQKKVEPLKPLTQKPLEKKVTKSKSVKKVHKKVVKRVRKKVAKKRVVKRKVVHKKVKKVVKAIKPKKRRIVQHKAPVVPKLKTTPEHTSKPKLSSAKATSKPAKQVQPQPQPQPHTPEPSYQERFVATYASKIRQAILRHKFYPRIAKKTKKEGVVELLFELTPQKELKNLTIIRSSGHKILDRAAMKCVRRASKEFPAPKECVKVKVPIEYRLR